MSDVLESYYAALDRLKLGETLHVPAGTKITRDAVSLEAGRNKGTIKRSRPKFAELIAEIENAAEEQRQAVSAPSDREAALRAEVRRYRNLWEESIAREVSLVSQLWQERQEWAREKEALTGEKVALIMRRKLLGSEGGNGD